MPPYNLRGERMAANSSNPRISIGLAWELHGEILWEGRMIGRQGRPCMNLFVMYRWFGVVPQGLDVLFPFVLFGDFRSPFLAICLVRFWGFSLYDLVGVYARTPRGFFLFDSPPKSVSKGARFWGFWCSRVRGVLGGISSIPLDLASFGGQNLGYRLPMRCSYYPQSLAQIRGAIREIGSWIWGVDPRVLFIPRAQATPVWPVQTPVGFLLGWTFGSVRCCFVLLLFWVWVSLEFGRLFGRFGVSWLEPVWPVSYTGLTGVGALLCKFPGFTSRDRSDRWCSPAWSV
jgi:hypothetical protein